MPTGLLISKVTKDLGNWSDYTKQDKTMIFIILIFGIICITIIIIYLKDDNIWTVEPAADEIINKRQKDRGIVTSIITSLFSVLISVIMLVGIKSNSSIYQALFSIICIGLIGFILDNAFATENGVSILLHGIDGDEEISFKTVTSALKYSYGSLLSSKTPRYFIVSMLDIFISLMLTDSIVNSMTSKFGIHGSISNIFAMVVVSITTFLAYSNATRLEWAYPAVDVFHERSALISTPTILITTVIAGMVYSIWTPVIKSDAVGITSRDGKLVMIFVLFALIIFSYYMGFLEPILKDEIKNDVVPCSSNPGTKSQSELCIVSIVKTHDIPTVKETYDLGTYGVMGFLILCIISTIIVLHYSKELRKYSIKNISLGILVIGIMTLPGIISFIG